MNLLYICDLENQCFFVRGSQVAKQLVKRGWNVLASNYIDEEQVAKADTIFFQRAAGEEFIDLTLKAQGAGKRIVYDIDDDVWHIPQTNLFTGSSLNSRILLYMEKMLSCADAVTVSTDPLNAIVTKHIGSGATAHTIPNFISRELWEPALARDKNNEQLIIGVVGGPGRDADLAPVVHPLNVIRSRYDVDIVVLAHEEGALPISGAMYPGYIQFEHYPKAVSLFDIALAPLADNLFNKSKSDIKIVDFAAASLPIVTSADSVYADSIEQGVTGLIAYDENSWIESISMLIESERLRRTLGDNARKMIAEPRFIEDNIGLWEDVLRNG